jgi:NurA-like 5'-3' nuclease
MKQTFHRKVFEQSKGKSMIVDVNELKRVKQYLDSINHEDIKNITWMEDGKECVIPEKQETLKRWEFVGLNNTDFIFTECYSKGFH